MSDPSALETSGQATMTFAEWGALPEDEPGELVDGRLEEEEVPDFVHVVIVGWLIQQLRNWMAGRGGFVGGSEAKFKVSARRGRKPDVFAYLPGGRLPPPRGIVRIPPDIMVEVVSPQARDGRRDRVAKLNEYAAFGVRFYWIVDPNLRSFEIFELTAEKAYLHRLGAGGGIIDPVPGCVGLRLDLDALWAECDRLGPDQPADPDDDEPLADD
ncbi:MAG TPA: Uma2 family endonuclease [Kofleriaceae bacterium]|nr:Uma2 family endonuclease [Kofleriaceae bacterium]